jgi:hypothetical protein
MTARKVCVLATISMLIFSLIAASFDAINAAIHPQTFECGLRDVLNLSVNIPVENPDYIGSTLNSEIPIFSFYFPLHILYRGYHAH